MCWNILGRHRYKHVTMLCLRLVVQHFSKVTTANMLTYPVRTAHDPYISTDQSIWYQQWHHIWGSVRQWMSQYGARVGTISWSGLLPKGHASHIQNMWCVSGQSQKPAPPSLSPKFCCRKATHHCCCTCSISMRLNKLFEFPPTTRLQLKHLESKCQSGLGTKFTM